MEPDRFDAVTRCAWASNNRRGLLRTVISAVGAARLAALTGSALAAKPKSRRRRRVPSPGGAARSAARGRSGASTDGTALAVVMGRHIPMGGIAFRTSVVKNVAAVPLAPATWFASKTSALPAAAAGRPAPMAVSALEAAVSRSVPVAISARALKTVVSPRPIPMVSVSTRASPVAPIAPASSDVFQTSQSVVRRTMPRQAAPAPTPAMFAVQTSSVVVRPTIRCAVRRRPRFRTTTAARRTVSARRISSVAPHRASPAPSIKINVVGHRRLNGGQG